MKRISLDNAPGKWFDLDRAQRFEEDTWWDGNNMVSKSTGSQFDHESLYRTASGWYVLHTWSQWQGSNETWVRVSDQAAYDWLLKNGYEDAIPAPELESRDLDAEGTTANRHIRIPDELWAKAQDTGNASKLIRDLLEKHFEQAEQE